MEYSTDTNMQVNHEEREVVFTRILDAPPEIIFKAITDPNLVSQWWGPAYLSTQVETMDVRPGGKWRFVQRDPEGNEFAFNGVYREVQPPTRLVYTFNFEGIPGDHELIETITLEPFDGKTKVTDRSQYQSIEDLEGMLNMGMESGSRESLDRLLVLAQRLIVS